MAKWAPSAQSFLCCHCRGTEEDFVFSGLEETMVIAVEDVIKMAKAKVSKSDGVS
jgi:hypothetical protein